MIKTSRSYKLCIVPSALEYSNPQQLKITKVISSWHHRSSVRINLGELSSITHLIRSDPPEKTLFSDLKTR